MILPNNSASNLPSADQLQGWSCVFQTEHDRQKVIELAFDYRGDVTLQLAGGNTLEGYVSNRDVDARPAFVELFSKHWPDMVTVAYDDIIGILFSGKDTAAGKSWEAWQQKVAEAEANGKIAELYPEKLDD